MKIDAVHKKGGGRSSATDDSSISSCLFLSAGTFCPNLTSSKNVRRIETQGVTISGTNSLATKIEVEEEVVRDEDDDDRCVDVKVASLDY